MTGIASVQQAQRFAQAASRSLLKCVLLIVSAASVHSLTTTVVYPDAGEPHPLLVVAQVLAALGIAVWLIGQRRARRVERPDP